MKVEKKVMNLINVSRKIREFCQQSNPFHESLQCSVLLYPQHECNNVKIDS